MIDKNLKEKVIDARSKDSKSIEVEGKSRFCGKRFVLKAKLFGDKRCIYCGRWFHWQGKDKDKWIRENNLDNYNLDNNIEPLHCGNSTCEDYHRMYKKVQIERAVVDEEKMRELFSRLKRRKLIV